MIDSASDHSAERGPTERLQPAQAGEIPRVGLRDRLSGAGPGGVILVCAPAGSGKTVLLLQNE